MHKIRLVILLCTLLLPVTSAPAQVSIGIGLPNVSIGINLPLYPQLVLVPGYPIYYAPYVDANYFFYDGMYWVYYDDYWYASSWYNGPWALVRPEVVPLFILRIPVRYYRHPPAYFYGWRKDAPPHWGERWGPGWEQHRRGWDRWNRSSAPAPAPLPVYQRRYSGDRYPRSEQQRTLRERYYRYQPHNTVVRQHYRGQGAPVPAQRGRQTAPPPTSPGQHEIQRSAPPPQGGPAGPRSQPPHRGGKDFQHPSPVQPPPQQRGPAVRDEKRQPGYEQPKQQAPGGQGREKRPEEPGRGHGQEKQKGGERDRDHDN